MQITIDNDLLALKAAEYSHLKHGGVFTYQDTIDRCEDDYKKGYLAALEDINTHSPFKITE